MPKKNMNESAVDVVITENDISTTNIVDESVEEVKRHTNKKTINTENLNDSDEIDVISIIPNVSYKDSKTGDMYEWDEVGHVEPMTFDTLKNMWRNHKGYFRNMWLKPLDDRVINKFGLTKTFEKYEYLMDESNYTRSNVKELCSVISNTPNELKYSIVNKIKDLISNGKLSDIIVVRDLEKHLDLDLISFLN